MSGFYVVEPCNSSGGFEITLGGRRLDLKKCEGALSSMGSVLGNSGVVMLAKVNGFALSVYGSGRIMVKPASRKKRKPGKADMDRLAERLVKELERSGAII
jgi:hypothetical protein